MKKVLIVGGSRGIGNACVKRYCENGDRVLFLYHTHHEAAATLTAQTGAEGLSCDVGDPDSARAAVEKAIRHLNGLDTLVINAGIALIKPFGDVTRAEWDRLLAVNLTGAYSCNCSSYIITD